MRKVCWDSQTLAFQGPPAQCPVPVAMPYWEEVPIWNMHYDIDLINSPWKWVTTAPEAHGVQVLPYPRGWGVPGRPLPQNLPAHKNHACAKFRPAVWISIEI